MDSASVAALEQVCMQFYCGLDRAQRESAQATLLSFDSAPDCVARCRSILDLSSNPYAQLLALSTLTKAVAKIPSNLTLTDRVMIRNYSLEFLFSKCPLETFVTAELCKLVARITKLGWFDQNETETFPLRSLLGDVSKFFETSAEHCNASVLVLTELVSEMNQPDTVRGLSKHRKISSSFRDEMLFDIFQRALEYIRKATRMPQLLGPLLQLARTCLLFDFIGTCADESADELRNVHLPSSWRDLILNGTLALFFEIYVNVEAPLSGYAMGSLVQLASIRRTLFTTPQRAEFLSQLIAGISTILRTSAGLKDPDNYHEFCRLLARVKTNYQLNELVMVDSYDECIRSIASFTVVSFQNWQWSPNSTHYILGLWERLVSSIIYVKVDKPHNLQNYCPAIVEAYITSRLASVEGVLRGAIEDPLEDVTIVEAQLKQFAVIARCRYESTCEILRARFDPLAREYLELTRGAAPAPALSLQLIEGQLTWLVYIIASTVGSRMVGVCTDDADAIDGELICRALQVLQIADERLRVGPPTAESLDLAILYFLQQFRTSYVGADTLSKTSKVFLRLSETLGLVDENAILNVFLSKIITNLKMWSSSASIIDRTLRLLGELSQGYTSVRRLIKLETVQVLLEAHTAEHFAFLTAAHPRSRTLFYQSLGRMLLLESLDDAPRFARFIAPFSSVLQTMAARLAAGNCGGDPQAKIAVIGLARDLRGIASACTNKSAFSLLFDWLYPNFFTVIVQCMEVWRGHPDVVNPILKFFCEVVQNNNSRLQFGVYSPNGILLFRATSKALVTFGSSLPAVEGGIDIYQHRYKGIAVCFNILRFALVGEYVNFGVFALYGDDALDGAMGTFFSMLGSIAPDHLLAYPKLCRAYFLLLATITKDHIDYLARADTAAFRYIAHSVSEGIRSVDLGVSSNSCNSLDFLLTAALSRMARVRAGGPPDPLLQLIATNQDIFSELLSYLLGVIMFEECKNQWSASRPLLGLIILQPARYQEARQQLVTSLPLHKQMQVAACFDTLMDGVENSLSSKNRDKFTQNLGVFRREINPLTATGNAPSPTSPPASPLGMS
eukprot:m.48425 g.48425  ORF g.48425 m.48425 type:complete len:1073 (+) comp11378_c0_seq3:31-3249(+)